MYAKKFVAGLLIAASSTLAQAIEVPDTIKNASMGSGSGTTAVQPHLVGSGDSSLGAMGSFDRADVSEVIAMPIDNIMAVEAKGDIYFVSGNGRYIFSGRMHDLWYGEDLTTTDKVERSSRILDMEALGIDTKEMNTVSVGEGDVSHTVFIDPLCESCLEYIEKAKSLSEEGHAFDFIVVPALGKESEELATKISCRKDEGNEVGIKALINKSANKLDQREDCEGKKIISSITLADLLKVDGVPFTINKNGVVFRGLPDDMRKHLEGEK